MAKGRAPNATARRGISPSRSEEPPWENDTATTAAAAAEPTITLGLQQFQTLVNHIEMLTATVQHFQEAADNH